MLYQPQPQEVEGNKCTGVCAFSILPSGKKDPLFGALFFDAKMEIDRDSRRYQVSSIQIPNIKFSGLQQDVNLDKIKAAVIREVPTWKLQGSLDELIATVQEISDKGNRNSELKHDPPKIIFTTKPSMLIMIDGEPKMKDIESSDLSYVANTPYMIFHDKSTRKFYLYGGEIWYEAVKITGDWTTTKIVPKDILKLMEQNKQRTGQAGTIKVTDKDVPPFIIVAMEPTELIQTNGEPNYIPVNGSTDLLYAKNSEDNLFKEISTNNYYILKSGRWFASQRTSGPWKFVPSTEIPADFNMIEQGAEKDIVRASVPGTDEARDALLDAQLPQTATIDRRTAGEELKVEYDGAPRFNQIQGTSLLLAENANKTVMKSGSLYYCVENGVWFESASYNGPWVVSTSRPADVDNIPASSSAYNTKFVQIYDYTPDVVYVGYTPGYMGCYIYGPTVVYGTGWYYRPYYGSWYYPYHSTWGFNMNYNPWTGWGIGFSYSTGPYHFGFGTGGFSIGMSWGFGAGMFYPAYGYGGGWFGPPMYRPPCFAPSYPWYGYNRPGYNYNRPNRPNINSPGGGNINWGGGNQINVGGDVNINVNNPGGNNLYNRGPKGGNKGVTSGIRDVDLSKVNLSKTGKQQPAATRSGTAGRPTLPNNVFADKDGNIFKKDDKGQWQQNNGRGWSVPSNIPSESRPVQRPDQPISRPVVPDIKPSVPKARPTAPSGYSRPSNLNMSDMDRNRATQRSNTSPTSRQVARPKTPGVRPVPKRTF